ncbi:hypothetical protein SLA2020_162750 [Shorea laevis]
METFRNSPLKPWKNGPTKGKGGPLNASCQYWGRKLPLLMMRLQGDSMDLMLTSICLTFNPTHILILRTDLNGLFQRISSPCHKQEEPEADRKSDNQGERRRYFVKGMLQPEKSQIDLNEFLQQLGIVREDKEKSFDWDSLIEMNGIGADNQGANAGFHVHDIQEELMWPTSIWNF